MPAFQSTQSDILATAHEVLPKFGLAFVVDDTKATWAITHHMDGPGLDALRPGQRVQLTVAHHADFSVVRAYQPHC